MIPSIIFTDDSANNIRNALNLYTDKSKQRGKTNEEKTKFLNEAKDALANLKECIQKSIGQAQLHKDLNLKDTEKITKDHLVDIDNILVSKYNGKKNRSKFDDFEKDIEDIKKQIGDKIFDVQLAELGKVTNWGAIETKPENIKACIEKILNNTTKPEPRKPFQEELKQIKKISVQTKNGRILFIATP